MVNNLAGPQRSISDWVGTTLHMVINPPQWFSVSLSRDQPLYIPWLKGLQAYSTVCTVTTLQGMFIYRTLVWFILYSHFVTLNWRFAIFFCLRDKIWLQLFYLSIFLFPIVFKPRIASAIINKQTVYMHTAQRRIVFYYICKTVLKKWSPTSKQLP